MIQGGQVSGDRKKGADISCQGAVAGNQVSVFRKKGEV